MREPAPGGLSRRKTTRARKGPGRGRFNPQSCLSFDQPAANAGQLAAHLGSRKVGEHGLVAFFHQLHIRAAAKCAFVEESGFVGGRRKYNDRSFPFLRFP